MTADFPRAQQLAATADSDRDAICHSARALAFSAIAVQVSDRRSSGSAPAIGARAPAAPAKRMGDAAADAAFEARLRAALSKFVAVKPAATVAPPRAAKLAHCASVAAYVAAFGCRAVRVAAARAGVGRRLVATRAIAADAFVFAERPAHGLTVADRGDKAANAAAFAAAACAARRPPLVDLLLDLARARAADPLAGAYLANAMELEPTEECGVFPLAAMCNHACDANCAYAVDADGSTLYLQATRPIAAGDELTLSYVACLGETRSTRARRDALKRSFGFDCACPRCAADDPPGGDPPPAKRRRRVPGS